ncbi:MAG: hypothetical protein ABIA91_00360 [Patescibacteria group bacterium]
MILITVKNEKIYTERIADRLNNSPHYKRILQKPSQYFEQQQKYVQVVEKSNLDHMVIDMSTPLDKKFVQKQVKKILTFLGENK